jgi:hypothetical protein
MLLPGKLRAIHSQPSGVNLHWQPECSPIAFYQYNFMVKGCDGPCSNLPDLNQTAMKAAVETTSRVIEWT